MRISGAEIVFECLQQQGVNVIFGYPGGVVLSLYDKLKEYPGLRHYLVRHEQNAVFAAQGYARSTGRVGVCIATSGPGATNLVTGLADAFMDSIPVVAITGQVNSTRLGTSAFQEADTVGITRPCTKHSYLVKETADLPLIFQEAFQVASTGRPGPVLIDLPKDVLLKQVVYKAADTIVLPVRRPFSGSGLDALYQAASLIVKAKKPVVYAGGGIVHANAWKELRQFVELTQIPVAMTVMALGAIPSDHPLSLGMLGMHGSYATNMAVQNADLLITLGARFDDRVTGNLEKFAPHAKIIHADIDPSEIGKNVKVDLALVGDAKLIVSGLSAMLLGAFSRENNEIVANRTVWRQQISEWQRAHPLCYESSQTEIKPQALVRRLDSVLRGKHIVSVDVGQHQMWAAQYLRFDEPRTWLNSGGLGSMGFGLPAAIGAAVAHPDKISVALVGDGGFQMSLPELGTLAAYQLPVKIIVMNNGFLGMVRQWQELFYNRNYSEVKFPVFPDCEKLSASYGIPGGTVSDPDELLPALATAMSCPGPYLLDVRVSPEENVYPIVPAEGGLDEMLLAPGEPLETALAGGGT